MEGNCFINNEMSITPVISQGGQIKASSNFGPKTAAAEGCEFIADFEISDTLSAPTGASAVSINCIDFDGESCFEDEPSGEKSNSKWDPKDGKDNEGHSSSATTVKNSLLATCLFSAILSLRRLL